MLKYYIGALLAGIAVLPAGCGDDDPIPPDCTDDRCNAAEDREALLASIEGFDDPISTYLRTSVQDDGTLSGDYRDILEGVGSVVGCDATTQKSFVVLSNEALNPKTVFNRCAASPIDASEFFLLLPSLGTDRDVEPRLVHMTAWDDTAGRYRRFATAPLPEGGMNINVEPVFCLGCHAGPRQLTTWQPLMNEMTNPWSQWNAEPGFVSHVFDEFFPEDTSVGPVYAEVSAEGLLDSASNLEPIIRAGIDRVTGARVQDRKLAPNAGQALKLLQPLFCDEHVNFVSEIHGSGEFRSSALVDDALAEIFTAMDVGQEHSFTQDTTMRIAVKGDVEDNLTLMAVRGESSLRAELALVTRQALTPLQALQVRSLDWMTPVDSSFRCSLFEDAETRILAGSLDSEIAALPVGATNEQLLPIFLSEIMSVEVSGQGDRMSLQAPGDSVYSIPDAAAVAPADYASLVASPAQFAAAVQLAIDSATREELNQRRKTRACAAAARYPTAPILSDVSCP